MHCLHLLTSQSSAKFGSAFSLAVWTDIYQCFTPLEIRLLESHLCACYKKWTHTLGLWAHCCGKVAQRQSSLVAQLSSSASFRDTVGYIMCVFFPQLKKLMTWLWL